MPGIATTTPEILIAHVASATSRIRLGAGGVMLPNHSALKVAESYKLLEALHPGRIDLGIGRAPGTDQLTAFALRRSRQAMGADDFLEQLGELLAWGGGEFPADHPFRGVRAMPDDRGLPPLYILGSSDYSAKVAADLGLGFAFAGHFSQDPPELALRDYRARFSPAAALERPHAILALSVFCADTEEAARRLASSMMLSFVQLRTGRPGRMPSPDEAMAHVFTPKNRPSVLLRKPRDRGDACAGARAHRGPRRAHGRRRGHAGHPRPRRRRARPLVRARRPRLRRLLRQHDQTNRAQYGVLGHRIGRRPEEKAVVSRATSVLSETTRRVPPLP